MNRESNILPDFSSVILPATVWSLLCLVGRFESVTLAMHQHEHTRAFSTKGAVFILANAQFLTLGSMSGDTSGSLSHAQCFLRHSAWKIV
jgi:hypothetical protein